MSNTARAVLQQNLMLRGLRAETLDRIAALAIRRNYAKGTAVFRQRDAGDALYAVISGQVRISAMSADGREVFLSLIEAGETFGEIAVIDGRERTASAVAVADSSLFLIRRSDLLDLMARDAALAMHLLQVFCQRLRWTSELIEEVAFLELPARLARWLLRLSGEHGGAEADGNVVRLSQAELANFLGVSRQIVNGHLQAWRDRGWVGLSRGRIVVRDVQALAGVSRIHDRGAGEASGAC